MRNLSVVVVLFSLFLCWSVTCQTVEEYKVLELVNAARATQSLRPLFWNNTLYKAAKDYSESMSKNKFFSHQSAVDNSMPWDRLDSAGYPWMAVAENIANGGTLTSAAQVFTVWMNSEGHRKNILSSDVTEMGCGAFGTRPIYWTQVFGARWFECGNGFVDTAIGETCDDGNLVSGDGCNSQCKVENGYICQQAADKHSGISVCSPVPQTSQRTTNPYITKFVSSILGGKRGDLFEEFANGNRVGPALSVRRRNHQPDLTESDLYDLLQDEFEEDEMEEEEEEDEMEDEVDEEEEEEDEELLMRVVQLAKRYNQMKRSSSLFL